MAAFWRWRDIAGRSVYAGPARWRRVDGEGMAGVGWEMAELLGAGDLPLRGKRKEAALQMESVPLFAG